VVKVYNINEGHNVLSGFLIKHGSEVINMLLTEWNTDDAKVIRREEGLEKGREERDLEAARNMKAEGDSIEKIARISGLSPEEIERL
jgi:predicted transposase/invertase (TIGR01784 family)